MEQNSKRICPLCGGPNECAVAETGDPNAPCWCRDAAVNPAAKVLTHRSNNSQPCICKKCAAATQVNAKLYTTEHCHLCDEAEAIVRKTGATVLKIDIVDDSNLFDKYGTRIPVLQRTDNDAELDWPFDEASVSQFLA